MTDAKTGTMPGAPSTPAEHEQLLAQFPLELRELVAAELAAGNTIADVGHSHPAPPVGAFVKLARKATTVPSDKLAALRYRERPFSNSHGGEFSDPQGYFWVLEPPLPQSVPDMDAIREELNARERAANASRDKYY